MGNPIAVPRHMVRRDRRRAHPGFAPCWPARSVGNSGSTPPLRPHPGESRYPYRGSGGGCASARPGAGIQSVKYALNGGRSGYAMLDAQKRALTDLEAARLLNARRDVLFRDLRTVA